MKSESISKKARDLSRLGASKGGHARARSLTREQRSEIARHAVETRWRKEGRLTEIPRATHEGIFPILDIACAVLEDGTRVMTETNFMRAMNMYRSGALSVRRQTDEAGAREPLYLAFKNLKPFIAAHLGNAHSAPLLYRARSGGIAHGIPAEIVPKICEIWLDARSAGILGKRQEIIAAKAEILLRGLAHVGIVALIDEATGYQATRERDALAKILEAFVAKEIRAWVKTFPPDFYQEMFRLRELPYPPMMRKPRYIGHLTNDLVYSRLAPGVLKELQARNPVEDGRRRHRHHQWLTEDIGHPKLQQHLHSLTVLMKASQTWEQFKKMLDRALPKHVHLPLFDGLEEDR